MQRRRTAPRMAAYLEGYRRARALSGFDPSVLLGLLPAVGPLIQGIVGAVQGANAPGGGGKGGGAAETPNPFQALLGGAAGALGGAGGSNPLTGLLGLLGGAAGGGGGAPDAGAALMAQRLAGNPQTDQATKGALEEVVSKARQDSQAKQAADEVRAAVSPELQAVKSQVDALAREQREREQVAQRTRNERFQQLTLQKLNALLASGGGDSARRF